MNELKVDPTTGEIHDPLKALDEIGEHAPMWKPTEGDSITGVVRRYVDVELEKSGLTRICTLQTSPTECMAVFLSATVLRSEFARQQPAIGERIFIRFLGTPKNKNYHKYVLKVQDREEQPVSWENFGGAAQPDRQPQQQPQQPATARPQVPPAPAPTQMGPAREADPYDPFAADMDPSVRQMPSDMPSDMPYVATTVR